MGTQTARSGPIRSERGAERMRILLVEDDPRLGPSIRTGLEGSHYAVDLAATGDDGLMAALHTPYDLVILDVMLPGINGFKLCHDLRQAGKTMPILMLSALGELDQRINGLDLGADDYLVKPFSFRELEARVRALLRRENTTTKNAELTFLDITIDTRTHEVRRGERPIELTSKQYALLEFLLRHPRQVLSRGMIADHVWDDSTENLSNVIDVYIRYLRRKLCQDGEPDVIQTVRGYGYQLKESEQ